MPDAIRATRTKVTPDEFYNGIPNRSLTEDDWQALPVELRDVARKSPLYEVKTNDEMKAELRGAESAPEPEPAPEVPQMGDTVAVVIPDSSQPEQPTA